MGRKNVKIIESWNDLVGLESDTHYLQIDTSIGNGKVRNKETEKIEVYLSTHTFYKSGYKDYQRLLRSKGFRVKLVSWG